MSLCISLQVSCSGCVPFPCFLQPRKLLLEPLGCDKAWTYSTVIRTSGGASHFATGISAGNPSVRSRVQHGETMFYLLSFPVNKIPA